MPPLMPAAKLRPVLPSDDDASAGHVLAAVIADALDDGGRAAELLHREALARDAADEGLAARRAVERHVAGNHVVLSGERRAVAAARR
mgnify:CR=1 FL=1